MTKKFKTVPLPEVHSLSKNVQEALNHLPGLNVYKMFAHIPTSLIPFTELAQSFLKDGGVDLPLLEIAILRVAHVNNCLYQWHQHEEIAKTIGITEKEITAIGTEKVVESLSPEKNFICKIADELTTTANLSNKVFEELFVHYSIKQGIAIVLCISFYNMVSRFLNATRVQIEQNNPLEGKSSPLN